MLCAAKCLQRPLINHGYLFQRRQEEGRRSNASVNSNCAQSPPQRIRVQMPAPRTTSKFLVNKYHIYGKSVIIFWSNLQLRVNMHQSTLRKSILAAYVRAVDSCSPWICWARQIKSVDGFVFFRLSLILIVVTCNYCCLPFSFHIRGRFFGDISHDKCRR